MDQSCLAISSSGQHEEREGDQDADAFLISSDVDSELIPSTLEVSARLWRLEKENELTRVMVLLLLAALRGWALSASGAAARAGAARRRSVAHAVAREGRN